MQRKQKLTMPSGFLAVILLLIGALALILLGMWVLGLGRPNSEALVGGETGFLAGWAVPGGRHEKTQEFKEQFDVGANPRLVVRGDVGTIEIVARGTTIDATATVVAWGASDAEAEEALGEAQVAMARHDDGTVWLESRLRRRLSGVRTPGIRWVITVPPGAEVEASSSVGAMLADGEFGPLRLAAGVGDVTLSGVAVTGSSTVSVAVGKVKLTAPPGAAYRLDARTAKGSVSGSLNLLDREQTKLGEGEKVSGDVGSSSNALLQIVVKTGDIQLGAAK